MNKEEKEILQSQLNREKQLVADLKYIFGQAQDDVVNKIIDLSRRKDMENLQTIIFQKQYQEVLRTQLDAAIDMLQANEYATIQEYLNDCYTSGYTAAMYEVAKSSEVPIIVPIDTKAVTKAIQIDSKLSKTLYKSLDMSELKKSVRMEVSRGILNGSSWLDIGAKIGKNIKGSAFQKPLNYGIRIARTEGHRIQVASAMDAQAEAKKKGADVVKQWSATLDSETRPTHQELDGQIRETDEDFEFSGGKVSAPGMFGSPAEDCNCRCRLNTRARWSLTEEELEKLKERAAFFGLDKTKDFDDFKQKYLKLPKNADTMKLKNRPSVNVFEQTIGGLKCQVEEVKSQDFPDGSQGGVKKNAPAIVYTTPDGTRFIYQKKYDESKQTLTPEQAIEVWSKIPDNIRNKIQKEVYVVDYYNPQDSYWRKIYKNFDHSYATGGDEITIYRSSYHDMGYLLHTYCHEGGHYIDYTTQGADKTNRYSQQQKWKDAMSKDFELSGKKSYREYGENSELEDFADSVGYYVIDHDAFANLFPERTKLLDKILK